MLDFIQNAPPTLAWLLGFFMALSLKRGRVQKIIDQFLPTDD